MTTDRCPDCGRPFATEITTGNTHEVICQNGHAHKVVKVQQAVSGRTYQLEMEEKV